MNILIVDDSIVYRSAISKALEGQAGITSIKTASNGKFALEAMKLTNFDLITLDLEMPVMDGIQTIKEIRKFNKKVRIIVFSTLTLKGAEKTIEALTAGANDFLTKVEGTSDIEGNISLVRTEMLPRIAALIENAQPTKNVENINHKNFTKPLLKNKTKLLCIGSSTGGPDALKQIFSNLNGKFNFPVLIVQHMPPFFTAQLANMLAKISNMSVSEAKNGEILVAGRVYISPGDFHMRVDKAGDSLMIKLDQGPKVCYVRPSVDVLLESVADINMNNLEVIILTGMGEDGLNGVRKIKKLGAKVTIQDKPSSVVWGMPGAIANLNLQDEELPLESIADYINNL